MPLLRIRGSGDVGIGGYPRADFLAFAGTKGGKPGDRARGSEPLSSLQTRDQFALTLVAREEGPRTTNESCLHALLPGGREPLRDSSVASTHWLGHEPFPGRIGD